MRAPIVAVALLASFSFTYAVAQTTMAAPAQAQAHYSTAETEIGTLLDDPAARAIVDKHLPGFSSGDQINMARGMTLKAIQPFAGDTITDAVLAAIDADLASLSGKK
jgi:hypothetical protein